MPGLDFKSSDEQEKHDPATVSRNARIGVFLFTIYLAVYGVFVGVIAFRPDLMERTPLAGINVAVLYGFGLILGAFVIALVYGWLCRNPAATSDSDRGDR